MLRGLGAVVVEVRKPEQLDGLDGLVIPGGESTAIGRLIRLYGLEEAIRRFEAPIFGTCAGMILLDRRHLGLLDLEVERNAYGRQVASFEADLELQGSDEPLRGVFIRAPRVADVGPEVEVLAEHDGEPVLLRQGRIVVASFHPELTDDTRVHELFLDAVREELIVEALTDNRNRTASDVRHVFSKNDGNLGGSGAVSWLFERRGVVLVDAEGVDEDELMLAAAEGGADDVELDGTTFQVTSAPENLVAVREAIEAAGITVDSAELTMVPKTTVEVADEATAKKVLRLVDQLEENDDVQDVFANFDIPEQVLDAVAS